MHCCWHARASKGVAARPRVREVSRGRRGRRVLRSFLASFAGAMKTRIQWLSLPVRSAGLSDRYKLHEQGRVGVFGFVSTRGGT